MQGVKTKINIAKHFFAPAVTPTVFLYEFFLYE